MMRRPEIALCVFFLLVILAPKNVNANTDPTRAFIENKNQWPSGVDFSVKIPGGRLFIQPGRFSYSFIDMQKAEELHDHGHHAYNEAGDESSPDATVRGHNVHVNFLNANLKSAVQPFGKLDTYYNYFIGDSSHWASKAYAYSGILYTDFYKGIDLKVYTAAENLKYDYVVSPNADPSQIQVAYAGIDKMHIDDNGNLYVVTPLSEIIEKRPYAYQFINGKKIAVACQYVLKDNVVTFIFPQGYDSCHTLIIDPLLIFSTYSGSTADNWGSTATPGEHGNLYSAGVTNPATVGRFPTTAGSFQINWGGLYDIGILKYDSLGKQLLYASYLGGNQSESPHSLVVNQQDELIVLGTTSSTNFPTTTGVIDRSFNLGQKVSHVIEYINGSDIFLARISADGSVLMASTYLGGDKNDGINALQSDSPDTVITLVRNYGDELRGDVITDDEGNIYLSSVTSSSNFPVTKGIDSTYNGGVTDAVLMKVNSSLTKIIWSTFLGGKRADACHTIKLDRDKNIFAAGGTNSTNFPVTAGSYKTVKAGVEDGWIGKVRNDGRLMLASTFTGTTAYDQVYFIDLNDTEEVYVYGQTFGDFPISPGVFNNPGSGQFVQKFDNLLTKSVFSTVFGSGRHTPDISPTAFLVSKCNNLYMAGWGGIVNSAEGFWNSDTRGMPISHDAYQKTTSGSDFYFISLTDDATEFLYGTYLGGTQSRTHVDGGTSRFDKSGIVYHAVCSGCAAFNAVNAPTSDFPTTPGVVSRVNRSTNCNNAAFKFDLSILKARLQTNSIKLNAPGLNKVCIPDKIVFQNQSIGGETFEWDFGDGTIESFDDTTMIIHRYKVPGKYTVKLKAIDVNTCVGKDSIYTTVYVYDRQSKVQEDDAICSGTNYSLKATGGMFYEWKTDDELFHSFDNTPGIAPEDTTAYFVTITEPSGCVVRDTVQINVIPLMELDFELVKNVDCFTRPTINLKNITKDRWSNDIMYVDFGDGETSDADEVFHDYSKDSTYQVKMIGMREFCGTERTLSVPIYTLKVPNVITPTLQDDHNDTLFIQYKDNSLTPSDFGLSVSLIIYNRWGRVVYESDDYKNDWSANGLASGVYYYNATIDGVATCKDWIHVIK